MLQYVPSHRSNIAIVSTKQQIDHILGLGLHHPTPWVNLPLGVFQVVIVVEVKLRHKTLETEICKLKTFSIKKQCVNMDIQTLNSRALFGTYVSLFICTKINIRVAIYRYVNCCCVVVLYFCSVMLQCCFVLFCISVLLCCSVVSCRFVFLYCYVVVLFRAVL